MINAQFNGEKVSSNSEEAYSLYEKSRLGEKINNKIEYALVEALYLVSQQKMRVFAGKKELGFDALLKKMKRIDKKLEIKSQVFSDLRKKGYIVKTALKFGAEFRVYNKGVLPSQDHAKWIVYTAKESDILHWHEFAAKGRVAHSTKKSLLLAVVDEEGGINYYEVNWLKP